MSGSESRINELLVQHGYPADRVDDWWSTPSPRLDGLTPRQAWAADEQEVLRSVEAGYAASEDAARRLRNDATAMASLRRKTEELDQLYG